jgi:tetratricopeptide (TPR) repeat protein
MMHVLQRTAATIALLLLAQSAMALCGGGLDQNSWGRPLDYRSAEDRKLLRIVEPFHFTPKVENLEGGMTSPLPGDIHYTLMRFVNHYRALNSMANWQLKNGFKPGGEHFPAECYFERATTFTPRDPVLYVIWGNYLYRKKEFPRALEIYNQALGLDDNNADTHYSLGLLYLEMNDVVRAQQHADRAYALGYPLPGLRNKLQRRKSGASTTPSAGGRATPTVGLKNAQQKPSGSAVPGSQPR